MTRKMLIGVGALAALIAAGAAWAHGPGRGFMSKQAITAHVAKMEDLVQATPQQRTTIDASVNHILTVLQSQRKQRQDMHQGMMKLLTGDSPLTEDQVKEVAQQHAAAIQGVAAEIAPDIVAIHNVLTPAQRQTLAQHAQEMRAKHHGPAGGFGGPGE